MAKAILDARDLIAEARHLVETILMAGSALSEPHGNAIGTTANIAIERLDQAEALLAGERDDECASST